MIHIGKHVQIRGRGRRHGRHDFFGYGDAIRAALDRRLPRRPAWALDVGTGFGRNAVFLAHHLARGSHIWSVDPSEDSLKRGEEAVLKVGVASQVSLVPGAVERLPFADREFHLTMGVMIFHHLVEVPPALREMARVTRPGGKLLLVDWGPTAHLLPFAIEHRPEDFFAAHAVEQMLLDIGLHPAAEQHPMWYVVEAAIE
ncbi:MAG: methyltransferase domain-containing protein [candidate division NC10 bacterium]|nr:methyltransferase domain-containing protein [candidate division NC10 bacterium]